MNKERIATTENSKDIKATPETLYRAFTTPEALEAWLAPGKMTGKMHNFDLKAGEVTRCLYITLKPTKNPVARLRKKRTGLLHDS